MDQFKHLDDSTIYDKLYSVSRPSASRVRNKNAPTVYRSTGPSTFLIGCVIRSEAVILPLRRQSRMRCSPLHRSLYSAALAIERYPHPAFDRRRRAERAYES